jgi:DNA uptake protein ComE-like DNA-binding protein
MPPVVMPCLGRCLPYATLLATCLLLAQPFTPPAAAQEWASPNFPLGLDELSPTYRQQRRLSAPDTINLNTADLNELMTLPYITQSMALAIIRFRPYRSWDELHRIRSLSPRQWRQLSFLLGPRVNLKPVGRLQQ